MKISRFGKTVLVVLALVIGVLALLGPRLVEKKSESREASPPSLPQVGITARGLVESSREIVLSSQVKGQIRRMRVGAGAQVKRGELLVEFDDEKVRAQLQQAAAALAASESHLRELSSGYRSEDVTVARSGQLRADAVYREAKDELERQRRLLDKNATTRIEVSRAEEKLKVAESQLQEGEANLLKHQKGERREQVDQARAERDRAAADQRYAAGVLQDYRVVAPFSGLVTERLHDAGETTEVNTPLLKLIDPKLTRIRAELDETEIGKVTPGQQVEVTSDAYPGKVFPGSVTEVLPTVKKKTQKNFDPAASFDINTQEIHVELKDFSAFRNGMTVTVRFK